MRKQTWNEINKVLVNSLVSNRRIAEVLKALPRNRKSYDWEEINRAFVQVGFSNRAIFLLLQDFATLKLSKVRRSAGRFASIQS